MKTELKKLTVLGLGVVLAAALAAGCGNDAGTKQAAATKQVVKTVMSGTEAPLSWVDEKGEKHGYEYEVLLEINKRLQHYELDIQAVPPETQDVMMESGDAKVAAGGYFRNKQREENFLLPESPTGASSLVVYVTQGNERKYKNLEELVKDGKSIVPVTPNGGAFRQLTEWNKKHGGLLPEIPIQSGSSAAEKVKELKEGRYFAYVVPNNLGVLELAEQQGLKLAALEEPLSVNATYLLVNKKEDKLAAELNEALKGLREDGTLSQLSKKWYKEDLLQSLK